MLYAEMSSGETIEGHVGQDIFKDQFGPRFGYPMGVHVRNILADGNELDRCLELLGRPSNMAFRPLGHRVHTFFGDVAQEIAYNWFH